MAKTEKARSTPAPDARDLVHRTLQTNVYHPFDVSILLHRTHRGKSLDFDSHSYLLKIYQAWRAFLDGEISELAQMKGTQAGSSEWAEWFAINCARILGMGVFYVLPTLELAGRVVRNRFDRTVERTPIYTAAVQHDQVYKSQSASVRLKHYGPGVVAFVGSNASSGFTEFPGDLAIEDEEDECNQENLEMVPERLSNSDYQWRVRIGNPTLPNFGISKAYEESSKFHWTLKCPSGHHVILDFWKHVVRDEGEGKYRIIDPKWEGLDGPDARVICDRCGKPINRRMIGEWVPENQAAMRAGRWGFHFNKLFTGKTTVNYLLGRLDKGTRSEEAMTRLWNGDLGLPFMAKGAKITRDMLDACVENYALGPAGAGLNIVGIDVGTMFNVIVGQVRSYRDNDGLRQERLRIIEIAAVPDLRQIMDILRRYRVICGSMDALPEKRITRMVCLRHPGMFAVFYVRGRIDIYQKGKVIGVDRTSTLDQSKDAVLSKYIMLPSNAATIPDFYDQVTAPTRVFNTKADAGRGAWEWQEGGQPDHYAHALGYLVLARNLAARVLKVKSPNIPKAETSAPGSGKTIGTEG